MGLYYYHVFTLPTDRDKNWYVIKWNNPTKIVEGATLTTQLNKAQNEICVQYSLYNEFNLQYRLRGAPANCGLVILHSMESYVWDEDTEDWDTPEDVGTMNVDAMFDIAIALSEQMGYSQILYTVCDKQEDLIEALVKKGFKLLEGSEVRNKRSGNDISMYVYNI
jgi:hypothetical protein